MRRQICLVSIIILLIQGTYGQVQQNYWITNSCPRQTLMADSISFLSYPADNQMLLTRSGVGTGRHCDEGPYDANYQFLENVSKVYLYVELSFLDGTFAYGDRGNSAEDYLISSRVNINYYTGIASGTPMLTEPCTLRLSTEDNTSFPDKRCVYKKDITTMYRSGNFHSISIGLLDFNISCTDPSHPCNSTANTYFNSIKNNVRVKTYYVVEKKPILLSFLENQTYMSYMSEPNPSSVLSSNKKTFKWSLLCGEARGYQFQLLRLYNYDATKTTETSIGTKVNWDEALTLESMSPKEEISLTIAEGTGYYVWRVRPIFQTYEALDGEEIDYRNYGAWSDPMLPAPINNYINIDESVDAGRPGIFYYTQFDADINWIHSQVFAEGSAENNEGLLIKEGMVYADGLNNIKQQQSIVNGEGVVVTQNFIDNSGRSALTTLPIPLDQDLGYIPKLITSNVSTPAIGYDAKDFDLSSNCMNPKIMYIKGQNNQIYTDSYADTRIASADGYMFTRNVFNTDGSNNIKEKTLPGEAHKLKPLTGPGSADPHTYRNGEGDVTPDEIEVLFGTETPEATSIKKKYNVDPNGTVSISYVNTSGQTIATCLQKGNNNLLDNLDELGIEKTVSVDITNSWNEMGGGSGIQSIFQLYVPNPSMTINLDYNFKDEDILTYFCEKRCTTCDYVVEIKVRYLDADPGTDDIIYHWEKSFIPDSDVPDDNEPQVCKPYGTENFTKQLTLTLPGNYVVERVIKVNNEIPGGNQTYYQKKKQELISYINTEYQNELLPHLVSLDGTNEGLERFYESFGPSVTINEREYKLFKFNCDEVYIPVERCATAPCSTDNNDLDQWATQFLEYNNLTSLPTLSNGRTFDSNEFTLLIRNMITDGHYDCEKLWSCWQGIVIGYQTNIIPPTSSTMSDYVVYNYDYIEDFLSCAGKTCSTESNENTVYTNSISEYKKNAYKRVFYTDYNKLQACIVMIGATLTPAINGEQYFSAIQSCIGNNFDANTMSDFQTDLNNSYGDMTVNLCENSCEGKRSAIEAAIKNYYLTLGYYIEGESYVCPLDQERWVYHQNVSSVHLGHVNVAGTISRIDFLCYVDGVINNCKNNLCLDNDSYTSESMNLLINGLPLITDILCSDFNYETGEERLLNFLNSEYLRLLKELNQSGFHCNNWNIYESILETGCNFESCGLKEYFISVCDDPNVHLRFTLELDPATNFYRLYIYTDVTTYAPDGTPTVSTQSVSFPCLLNNLVSSSCSYPCVQWVAPEPLGDHYIPTVLNDCLKGIVQSITTDLEYNRMQIVSKHVQELESQYQSNCIDNAHLKDHLTVSYNISQYHYTLYYYDRAGNLVRTVPPKGFNPVANRAQTTAHTLDTRYEYNSIKQLISQQTPDGGFTKFFYDSKGNLRFSQNAKQAPNLYSYTKFDNHYRTIESGQFQATESITNMVDDVNYPYSSIPRTDLNKIVYSEKDINVKYLTHYQEFLDSRISYTISDEDGDLNTLNDQTKTYYSYDPHGNVNWLVQYIYPIGKNYLKYDYDLISGSVLKVSYNEMFSDKMFHKYTYDADKRLKTVQTSRDNAIWETDATYDYYRHGPLARVRLGDDRVQGMDYVYTIHGWLKGINTIGLTNSYPNSDGISESLIPKDVVAFGYKYYDNDFGHDLTEATGGNLYNGNIGQWMSVANLPGVTSGEFFNNPVTKFQYRYDELNRLKTTTSAKNNNGWTSYGYKESFTYDPNGNINELTRSRAYNGTTQYIDDLYYTYQGFGNKLNGVFESQEIDDPLINDIKPGINAFNPNYTYDAIGNLVEDKSEKLRMEWNAYGKLSKINKYSDANLSVITSTIKYYYDSNGNRVKVERANFPIPSSPCGNTAGFEAGTYYVRDAQGNIMSVYTKEYKTVNSLCKAIFTQTEVPIYGSDRIGMYRNETVVSNLTSTGNPANDWFDRGETNTHIAIGLGSESMIVNRVNSMSYLGNGQFINTTQNTRCMSGTDSLGMLSISAPVESISGAQSGETSQLIDHQGMPVATFTTLESYNGVQNVGLLLNQGNMIYQNSDSIITAPKTSSVLVRVPQSNQQAYLFTVGSNRKLYKHILNYQTGKVLQKNIPVDTAYLYTGSLTAKEDYNLSRGDTNACLYALRKSDKVGAVDLVMHALTSEESIAPLVLKIYSADYTLQNVPMAISSDQKYIAMGEHYGFARSFNGMYDSSFVRVYTLDSTYKKTTLKQRIKVPYGLTKIENITFNSIDSVYFVYSLNDKTQNMSYYGHKGLAEVAVNSNILRNTDDRLYVGTASGLRAYNSDGTYTTMANMANYHPIFISTPIVINPWVLLARTTIYQQQTGKKVYELKDHLGNVRATITDRKFLTGITAPAYQAEPVTATDYYAFGSPLYGRNYTAQTGGYRFGFNGKENDNEVKGEGNSLDFGARIYDSRLGRWLSLDPLQAKYPSFSPYAFCANNPINFIDYDGKDFGFAIDQSSHTIIITANIYTINEQTTNEANAAAAKWTSLNGGIVTINGEQFTVEMKITVIEAKATSENSSFEEAHRMSNEDSQGNTYNGSIQGLPSERRYGKTDRRSETKRGKGFEAGLSDGKNITMPLWNLDGTVSYGGDDPEKVSHDMGHFFGLDDFDNVPKGKYTSSGGAMDYAGPYDPNMCDMENIIKYALDNSNNASTSGPRVSFTQSCDVGETKKDYDSSTVGQ